MVNRNMEPRDYDRANSGGTFNDETGDFSRSPERDHNWNVRAVEGEASSGTGLQFAGSIPTGAEVVGRDLDGVGTVKELGTTSFLVDRAMQRDVWVPFSAVQSVDGGRVVLDVMAGHVDDMGWENPSLGVGTDDGPTGTDDIVV